ncbi:MAG: penicillin-binding transpeptidase domain-containing protein [Patescibacteria group bacterium]|nr:penicillin-binding transpeptidase domain-containing protein [Patescibacteria group bacterium]
MRRRFRKIKRPIDPDATFLDSSNLPSFDNQQFEGRLERPIKKPSFYILGLFCLLIGLALIVKVGDLQIINGGALAWRGQNNTLRQIPVFAERGLVTDRLGVELAWSDDGRHYRDIPGFAHLVGYIGYPTEGELAIGDHHPQEMLGRDGAEKAFNDVLRGRRGTKIEEVDVLGRLQSDYILEKPDSGDNLELSIDARVQEQLYSFIDDLIDEGRFVAGAGAIMDVNTGELLALVSAPEYQQAVLVAGDDKEKIDDYLNDAGHPFLNRALAGLYTPGSIVKPIMALAALNEGVISPEEKILSTGELVVPNPFFPDLPSIFKDWRAHGWVDMRQALAVSSNVYFYNISGGFGDQAGVGISGVERYARLFGLGEITGINLTREEDGVVPTPRWKAEVFNGDDWRLGDTYHTAIGQYGFQVTPIQMVRAVSAIANGGLLLQPTVVASEGLGSEKAKVIAEIDPAYYQVIREGMRLGAIEGTGSGLNTSAVAIAVKTGTAELGISKEEVNSWATGFFPYEQPRYAFVVVMERGARSNVIGGVYVMRQLIDWLSVNAPEYLTTG